MTKATQPRIREAKPEEIQELSRIAKAAKGHWGYPEEWMQLWDKVLTFTQDYLRENCVLVAEDEGKLIAVGALAPHDEGLEIDHLWVDPNAMGRGAGRLLFHALKQRAEVKQAARLVIIADPYAVGFYEKMGASVVGEIASMPAGRRLPKMMVSLTA